MYEKLEKCPVCNHKQFDNYMICEDHSVSGESFALVKCRDCSLVFTNPRPELNNLEKYYQSDQYISHTDKANSLVNLVYKIVRNYTLSKKVSIITKLNRNKGSLLDYGCGTGHFLKKASAKGWQAFGYEPDEEARKLAEIKNPKRTIREIKNIPDDLDIITLWHVIEHIADLNATLKSLVKKLRKGGHFVIAVPNHKSYDSKYYQELWAGYDVPRHLYHFDQESIKHLAKNLKLKIVQTLPMKFDSYYVSMLSEKYKKGNILNALRIGLKSNNSAEKTGEYSSLIYILKK